MIDDRLIQALDDALDIAEGALQDEARPFPSWTIPGAAGELVVAGAKAFQCSEAMIGPLTLGALFGAVGNARAVAVTRSWTERAIAWIVVVAKSGSGKSPVLECVMRPLELQDEALYEAWEFECAEAEREGKTKPNCERLTTGDVTFEGLGRMLAHSPRGMILVADELAGWLGGFTRYAGGRRAASEEARWLLMHRGGLLRIDRKGSDPLRVPRASLSIVGGIQPGVLAKAVTTTDFQSGLVARMLMSMPELPVARWDRSLQLPEGLEERYGAQLNELFKLQPVYHNGRPEPILLSWDRNAEQIWAEHYRWINETASAAGDSHRAALKKLEGMAARFALVIHLARRAAGEEVDPGIIDGESMHRAVVLVKWFWGEAQRVYRMLSNAEDADNEYSDLVKWIRSHGGACTVRDLTRGPCKYRGNSDRAEKELNALVAAGLGQWVVDDHGGGPGAPAIRFELFSRAGDTGDGDRNR